MDEFFLALCALCVGVSLLFVLESDLEVHYYS